MSYLYLIRHPLTQPDPALAPSQWRLAGEGHTQVAQLVRAPFWRGVTAVYTSTHRKTTVVGDAVRAAYGTPVHAVAALDEARRERWITPDSFIAAQTRFFTAPDQPAVPEWEPASHAAERFAAAVERLLAAHDPRQSLAVVSHASVLTLYVARLRGEPPTVSLWRAIGFAAVCAVDRATLKPVTAFEEAPFSGVPLPDLDQPSEITH